MLTNEEEIKLRLFDSIAANVDSLFETKRYVVKPESVADKVNSVYDKLFKKED